jgi:hypothetical protein
LHLAANLRVGGLRRDGYGVRHRCFAAPAGFLAPGDPATGAKKLTALCSVQTVFASMKRYARLDPRAALS